MIKQYDKTMAHEQSQRGWQYHIDEVTSTNESGGLH